MVISIITSFTQRRRDREDRRGSLQVSASLCLCVKLPCAGITVYNHPSIFDIGGEITEVHLTTESTGGTGRVDGERVGEVIGADSRSFVAQCYALYGAPPLGALLQVGDPAIYAVVQSVRTEPLDPSRPVLARGQGADSIDDVYRDNPQIERLLTTRFDALIVGHQCSGADYQLLPPAPPRIHSFVNVCSPDLVAGFTANLDFLRLLVNSGPPLADEVVVACLREAANCQPDKDAFVLRAGRALAAELTGDVSRLSAIMRRVTV